jgi:hypothetical protein
VEQAYYFIGGIQMEDFSQIQEQKLKLSQVVEETAMFAK